MKFPHPLALLAGCVLAAAVATYVLPAGRYERRNDPVAGREVVVPGTFHRVAPAPVGPFRAVVAIPRGMADAAEVIFLVFLVGGAFTVVDKTGALRRATNWLAGRLERRETLVIPVVAVLFATGGALENMAEEIIALVPVLVILTGRLGFQPIVAVSMSLGAAAVGAAFSPINPFQVGIAQKLAQLPLLSGAPFRIVFLAVALALWVGATMRHAARHRGAPGGEAAGVHGSCGARDLIVLVLVGLAFAALVIGVMRLDWGFNELSAAFFVMGVLAGLVSGLRVRGTAEAFVEGFASMAYAAMLIGFARAIYVVLDDGQIVDTVVYGLVTPLAGLPVFLSALGMMAVQALVHVPVPSVSGQAVLTMPVLVPLSDVIGLSRQVTVLAYQYGAGLCELLTPTNGALMAILAAAGVPYGEWLRFAVPRFA
ncbi:MAG: YfcC family protein, partial [Gemmatimonadetes bacterium]|nr:YfcC family protein [Gemmatimonadota bacterium]